MTCKSWDNIDLENMNYRELETAKKHLKIIYDNYKNDGHPIVKYYFHSDFYKILFNYKQNYLIFSNDEEMKNPIKIKIGCTDFYGEIDKNELHIKRKKDNLIYLTQEDIKQIDKLLKLIDNYLIISDCNMRINDAKEDITGLLQI